jgi:long-chain acyl-CoA synthetase
MRTLRDVIDHHAEQRPDAPFLIAPEASVRLTYSELQRKCRALEGLLQASGVGAGEVVSFMLPNGIAAATLFVGVMYAGRIVSPLNLIAQDALLGHVLAHSGTRMVFASADLAERIAELVGKCGRSIAIRTTDMDDPGLVDEPATPAPIVAESPALLMYTSGTTGVPKGALLAHRNLIHAAEAVVAGHRLTESDRVLSSLPLYHVNGQCIATLSPLLSGGSAVMPHRFSASQWWKLVERYEPTWLNMVPTIVSYLLNGPDLTAQQKAACHALRFARSASAPLPPEQHRAFETRFGVSIIEAMGLTECASVAFANPLDRTRRKYGSVGVPLGIEARVVDTRGNVVGDGERGEIQVRGANVMQGYYKAPDLTARTITADGWLATGDLGHRDDDGFYFVTGRLKELIIKGGENIAPREIDEALLKHPAVLEAAAVGVSDARYGQDIAACVVIKRGEACTEEALREHCLRELGRYKSPRILRFVDDLPKGPSGKVQRLKLLDLL